MGEPKVSVKVILRKLAGWSSLPQTDTTRDVIGRNRGK